MGRWIRSREWRGDFGVPWRNVSGIGARSKIIANWQIAKVSGAEAIEVDYR